MPGHFQNARATASGAMLLREGINSDTYTGHQVAFCGLFEHKAAAEGTDSGSLPRTGGCDGCAVHGGGRGRRVGIGGPGRILRGCVAGGGCGATGCAAADRSGTRHAAPAATAPAGAHPSYLIIGNAAGMVIIDLTAISSSTQR